MSQGTPKTENTRPSEQRMAQKYDVSIQTVKERRSERHSQFHERDMTGAHFSNHERKKAQKSAKNNF